MQENGKADAKEEGGREIKLTLPSLAVYPNQRVAMAIVVWMEEIYAA